MRRMNNGYMLAATGLFTLSLIGAPRTALAEQAAAEGAEASPEVAEQVEAADATPSEGGRAVDAAAPQGEDGQGLLADADSEAQDAGSQVVPAAGDAQAAGDVQADSIPSAEPGSSSSLVSEAPRNGIPTVTVFVDESDQAIADARANDPDHEYGTLEQMYQAIDHGTRGVGSIGIMVPDGYVGTSGTSQAPEGPLKLEYVRGRGNSTWQGADKKAFKLKLADKQDLFGMGASREWALMANAYDYTLLKNRITSWLGEQLGMSYTPQMVPVDVVLVRTKDGQELERKRLGSYCLSELVDIEPARIAIDKLKKGVVDNEDITGGYLLSIYTDAQNSDELEGNVFTLGSGMRLFTRSPEFASEGLTEGQARQHAYIRDYLAKLDELVMGLDAIDDARHDAIAELMDLRSAADYWWIQAFSNNGDAFGTSSTYLYKPRGGKLCWGPLWDFDIAWDGAVGDESAVAGFGMPTPWFDALRGNDPRFVELLRQRWSDPVDGLAAKLAELTRAGGALDAYADEIRDSWEENSAIVENGFDAFDDCERTSFFEAIEYLREWIDARRAWVDRHLDELNRVFVNLSFIVNGREVDRQRVNPLLDIERMPEVPDCEGSVFLGWCKQGSDELIDVDELVEDAVLIAKYVREDEVARPSVIFFPRYDVWAPAGEGVTFRNVPDFAPLDAYAGQIEWTSSDERVATVDSEGQGTVAGEGETIITATLPNGVSRSYVVHVYNEERSRLVLPTGVEVPREVALVAGGVSQLGFSLVHDEGVPSNVCAFYMVDDAEVVDVNDAGVISGLKPGVANVRVVVTGMMGDEFEPLEAVCKVTVVEPDVEAKRDKLGQVVGSVPAGLQRSAKRPAAKKAEAKRAELPRAVAKRATAKVAEAKEAITRKSGLHDLAESSESSAGVAAIGDEREVPSIDGQPLPQTGDVAQPQTWFALLIASVATFVAGLRSSKQDW